MSDVRPEARMLAVVRKAALPAVWSQGAKLAREGAVQLASRAAGGASLELRVRAPGHAIAPTVTLFVADEEWSCDCAGKVDPCAHVTAAAIHAAQLADAPPPDANASPAAPSDAPAARTPPRSRRREGEEPRTRARPSSCAPPSLAKRGVFGDRGDRGLDHAVLREGVHAAVEQVAFALVLGAPVEVLEGEPASVEREVG